MGSLVRVQAGEQSLAEMRGFFVGKIFPLGSIHEVEASLWDNLLLKFKRLFFNDLRLLLPKNAVFISFRQ
jgi:hypothetical protein